jgi:hypothetical protein
MQQRILNELRERNCDEIKLDYEAAQLIKLRFPAGNPAHRKLDKNESTRSRSRSPPEPRRQESEARANHRGEPDLLIKSTSKTKFYLK